MKAAESTSELFPTEFIEFTKQLKAINDWFEDYRTRRKGLSDLADHHVCEIINCMCEASYSIGELVSVEFKEALFYQGK